jgi:uncharacterized protein involved in tolerance to divalent cations
MSADETPILVRRVSKKEKMGKSRAYLPKSSLISCIDTDPVVRSVMYWRGDKIPVMARILLRVAA